MKTFLLPLVAILFVACSSENSKNSKTEHYFNTQAVIENVITDLNKQKPEVTKYWKYNTKTETKTIQDLDWQKELKLFADADINKSSFVASYDSVVTPSSVSYILKKGEKLPIKEMTLSFDSLKNLTHWKTISNSENYFFKTESEIELFLKNKTAQSYTISSTQKLLWFSPDTTVVKGELNLLP